MEQHPSTSGSLSGSIAALNYIISLCGILPLFPWLTPLPRLLLVAGLVACIWQDRRGYWQVPGWLLNLSIVPLFLVYAVQFSRSNPVQPVVSLLAVMLAVRLLGKKQARHCLQLHALSLFCLSASSLFDLSPRFLFALTVLLLAVAMALVLLAFQAQDSSMVLSRRELRLALLAGLVMPLVSLPLLALFFPILPRTQIPLWNLGQQAPTLAVSGFSDRVETGRSSAVGFSSRLAFRVEIPRQPKQQLYWRGTVFNHLERDRWVRDSAVPPERETSAGTTVRQTVFPEPGTAPFVLALDVPVRIALPRIRRFPDRVFQLPRSGSQRLSYVVDSTPMAGVAVPNIARAFYLQLPPDISPRFRRLAEAIRARGGDDQQRLSLLEQYYRNGDFRYSLQGLPTGSHALERFLFETRQGHCEFFASSFALLARAVGVPARLVGGYLGGEYNELGGYYLVTEQMAHVWVEVFLAGQGWLRVDPSAFARNADQLLGARREHSLAVRLRLTMDALDHAWNRSVITYDLERQVQSVRAAASHLRGVNAEELGRRVARWGVAGGAALFLVALSFRRRWMPSAEERLLNSFYRRIERDLGSAVHPRRLGLFELARVTGNHQVCLFAEIYSGAVYRDRPLTSLERRRLRDIIRTGFR